MPTTTLTPRQAAENAGFPGRHLLACPEQRLIVCAIPKNGCTTLKRWFLLFADPGAADVDDVHAHCADHWAISLWEGPPRDEALATYDIMVFLRDPLSRIASAYIEKFVGGHPYGCFEPAREVMEDVARLQGRHVEIDHVRTITAGTRMLDVPASSAVDYERGITFREFVHYLCRAPDDHMDIHWRPQRTYFWRYRVSILGTVAGMSDVLAAFSAGRGLPPPPPQTVYPRDTLPDRCLADVPSADLYQRYLHDRGVLPPAEALFDDDLRSLLSCRYSLDAELFAEAAQGRSDSFVQPRVLAERVGAA